MAKFPIIKQPPRDPALAAEERNRNDRLAAEPNLIDLKRGGKGKATTGRGGASSGGGSTGGGGGGGMTSFTLAGDGGSSQSITNGNTLTVAGGTGLTSTAGATDTVTLNLDNTAVTPGSYTLTSLTVDAQGRITAASNGSAGTMSSFTLAGSSGTQTIADGNTLTVAAGSGIASTPVTATDTVTINTVWAKAVTTISPATANDRLEVTTNVAAASAIYASNSSTTDGSLGIDAAATGASGKVHGVSGSTSSSDNEAYGGFFNRTFAGDWADVAEQASDPATPASGKGRYFGKTDGKAYYINDAGTVYDLTSGGGSGLTHPEVMARVWVL